MVYVIVGVIVLIVLYVIVVFNGLIKLKNMIDNGWSQIEVQLQRRYDLIPNLVETVKGYAAHEKETFMNVVKARQSYESASTVAQKAEADNMITGALTHLFALAENYPDLKASQNFRDLQMELTNTENKISFSRQFYNDTVVRFNTGIQLFPKNIIASIMHFTAREYFKTENEEAQKRVDVKF